MIRSLISLAILMSIHCFGQEAAAYISSKSVEVGSIIQVQFEIKLKPGDQLQFIPPTSIFPSKRIVAQTNLKGEEFEQLEIISFHDTLIRNAANKLWRGSFQLIPWDSGMLVLQPIRYVVNQQNYETTSILVEAKLVKQNKNVPIYDIKEEFTHFDKKFSLRENLYSYGWILVLFGVLAFIFWLYKKRKKQKLPIPKSISLKQQTLQSIEKLAQKKQWEKDQKTHYTELIFILRWYLSSRYQINLLERTSSDTLLLLTALKIDPYLFQQISHLFAEADTVKFANNELSEESHDKLIEQLREIVLMSSPIESKHV